MSQYVGAVAYQCHGKISYDSKAKAKKMARRAETKMGGGKLTPYRCPHCGWWHNGHDSFSLQRHRGEID